MPPAAEFRPYCGPAPAPSELIGQWNLDPVLLAALIGVSAWYAFESRRRRVRERQAFGAALLVLLVAFVSPLCALSSALFSARLAHHLLIVLAAAPLLAWSLAPARALPLGVLTAGQAVVLWLWHAPTPYAWALSGTGPYWIMEASLLGSATLFWMAVRARSHDPAPLLFALAASLVQTGLLGALITFAPRALYEPHLAGPLLWGLTPLEDQQLAGLIMWAPGALPYLLAALAIVARWFGPEAAARRT